jgi:hypothetical protein
MIKILVCEKENEDLEVAVANVAGILVKQHVPGMT